MKQFQYAKEQKEDIGPSRFVQAPNMGDFFHGTAWREIVPGRTKNVPKQAQNVSGVHRRDPKTWTTVEDMVRLWGWREFHQTYHGITTTGKIHLRQNCATCVNTSRWWQFSNGEVRANYNKLICSPCLDYQQDIKPVN